MANGKEVKSRCRKRLRLSAPQSYQEERIMIRRKFLWLAPLAIAPIAVVLLSAPSALAQPSAKDALSLKPMQKGIEYDQPEDPKDCRVAAENLDGQTAWVVRGPSGELLRRFVDSNADNKVDQWRYFKSGIEVYRDIDEDFNGKADQYRWLGTAGTRWGLDENEDGEIDGWKSISAEEVTAEVIEAIKNRDADRFENVVLKKKELDKLAVSYTHLTLPTTPYV